MNLKIHKALLLTCFRDEETRRQSFVSPVLQCFGDDDFTKGFLNP